MTARARTTASLLIAAFMCAMGAVVLSATPTQAADVSFDIDLGTLVPGEPVTDTVSLDVPTDSVVVRSEWVDLDGIARNIDWTIVLCGDDGCVDVEPPRTGEPVEAGLYTLSVTGVLSEDSPSGTGRATGVVSLMADPDGGAGGGDEAPDGGTSGSGSNPGVHGVLPWTGARMPWTAAALAAVAVILGLAALAWARRKEQEQ